MPVPIPPLPPPAPIGIRAGLNGLNQVVVSWTASQGVSSYIVERSLDATNWSTIATGVSATSLTDSSVDASTTYYYRALAVSSAGTSVPSAVASAITSAQTDSLAGQSSYLNPARGKSVIGSVATFTDANAATTAAGFTAKIHWGDGHTSLGTVTGGDGTFTVSGTHKFAALRAYKITVTVGMTVPDQAEVVVTSIAKVSPLAEIRLRSRDKPAPRLVKKPSAARRRER
jgi:hypothetical protein